MSRFFGEDIVEQVRRANDIVSVVSEGVTLKKKGKKYWGCCPFHNEKTPSFSVDAEKGMFYCFGCRVGGDVFSYVQKYENISFAEAVESLAQRVQIALPESTRSKASVAREKKNEQIYAANELATTFFHNCLTKTEMGKDALNYLRKRGLTDETIKKFRLGYAPPGWNKLHDAFIKRGIPENILLEAGLCRKNNNRVYDYFRERVMFPIADGRGRVLGFGGRVMGDEQPKYLNSSETELFNKSKVLFALNHAYKTIREKKQVILVEGYMDVITAHNHGVSNVVASLGTAFTKQQCQLMMRQADEIILAYDMDGAGREAVRRAIAIAQEVEVPVRILSMPSGKDPDDFIRNNGGEEFLNLVKDAIGPFDFILNESLIKHDVTNLDEKLAVLNEVFPFIASTKEEVKKEGYLRSLGLPLWLDNSTIFKYFREFNRNNEVKVNRPTATQVKIKTTLETTMVAMALQDIAVLELVMTFIPKDDYEEALYYDILQKTQSVIKAQGEFNLTKVKELLTEREQELLYAAMALDVDSQLPGIYAFIKKYRLQALQRKYKEHSAEADKLNRMGDANFINELAKCQNIQQEIQLWSRIDIEKGVHRE